MQATGAPSPAGWASTATRCSSASIGRTTPAVRSSGGDHTPAARTTVPAYPRPPATGSLPAISAPMTRPPSGSSDRTRVRLVWAGAGYTGKLATWAATLKMTLQIVAKRDPHAFQILPRRWVVERTFAWISKHRRTTRDYGHLPASHEAMILWAMIALMTRRLAQPAH